MYYTMCVEQRRKCVSSSRSSGGLMENCYSTSMAYQHSLSQSSVQEVASVIALWKWAGLKWRTEKWLVELLPSEAPLLLVLWLLMSMLAHMGQTGVKGHLGPGCPFHPFIWLRLVCWFSLNKKEHYCLIKVASLLLLLLFDSVFCYHWFPSL